MQEPQDAQLAAAALALIADAKLSITGKELGTAVAVHNWLEAIRTGERVFSAAQPPNQFIHRGNGLDNITEAEAV